MMNGSVNYRRRSDWVFLWTEICASYPEEVRGWFFDIYIQGSKYNF